MTPWPDYASTFALTAMGRVLVQELRTEPVPSPRRLARGRPSAWPLPKVAARFEPWRPHVALVATMRKMLVAVYSVAKHRRPFVAHQQQATTAELRERDARA